MTVKQTLKNSTDNLSNISSTPSLDAEVLLCYVLKIGKTKLYQDLEKKLSTEQLKKYQTLIAQRKKYKPVAYLTRHKEFYGLDFYVDERVLVPRPDTELLVEEIIKYAKKNKNQQLEIADVGTGSGCIAIALAKYLPAAKIYAIDISPKALAVAKINMGKHHLAKQIKLLRGDLLAPLKKKVGIIVANLPYLAQKNIPHIAPDVIDYEPAQALFAGADGLKYYQKLLSQANYYLRQPGLIVLEIDPSFKDKILRLAQKAFSKSKITIKKDLAGQDRVLIIKIDPNTP